MPIDKSFRIGADIEFPDYTKKPDVAPPTEEIFQMPGHEWKLAPEEEKAVRDLEEDARTTDLQRRMRRFIY